MLSSVNRKFHNTDFLAHYSNVFEEVNTNSIQIWKYGMYFLVVEYDVKPCMAPPFVFFEHIILGFRWLIQCCCIREESGEMTTL